MYEQGVHYSLSPWGTDTDRYKGNDDGGEGYQLPDGYEVAEDVTGDLQIYNAAGHACILVGRNYPALIDADRGPHGARLARI
jgi:hypothetical protein